MFLPSFPFCRSLRVAGRLCAVTAEQPGGSGNGSRVAGFSTEGPSHCECSRGLFVGRLFPFLSFGLLEVTLNSPPIPPAQFLTGRCGVLLKSTDYLVFF